MSGVIYVAVLSYFLRTRALTAFAAILLLAIVLHARPVFFLLGLDTPLEDHRFDDFFSYSAAASLSGIFWVIFFAISFVALKRPMAALGGSLLPVGPIAPNPRAMRLLAVLATLASVASTAYLIKQQGSIAHFIYAVKIGKELTGFYGIRQISILAAIICLYGLFASARPTAAAGYSHRRLPAGAMAFYGALIVVNFATNYFWGNRMNLVLFSFGACLGIHIFIRPFRPRELLLGLALAAAGLTGLGLLRNSMVREVSGSKEETTEVEFRTVSNSLHFVEFDGLMLALLDGGRRFDFRYGQDFYNGLVSWVPRSIMPERETFQVGGWFRRVYQPKRINGWPVTVIGEWYVNFGLFGIFLGAIISGAIVAMVNGAYRRLREHPWHVVMAPMLGFYWFGGGVDTAFPQGIFTFILPLGLLAFAVRQSSGRARSSASRPGQPQTPHVLGSG